MSKTIILLLLLSSVFFWTGNVDLDTPAGTASAQEMPVEPLPEEIPLPSVTVSASTSSGEPPLTVNFTSKVIDPYGGKYPVTYEWYFDDNTASTEKNPTHTFKVLRTYTVICKVTFWKSPKVTVQDSIGINVTSLWPAKVCTTPYTLFYPQMISDGSSGTIITWNEYRSGSDSDIYAQRIDGTGKVLWNANCTAICTEPNEQSYPGITPDGSGGAIIAWEDLRNGNDRDIYAQRVDSNGNILWKVGGVIIFDSTVATNYIRVLQITTDGSGGAVIAWHDKLSGYNSKIFVQRVNSKGEPQWTTNGVAVCTGNTQLSPQIISDGSGGCIITWRHIIPTDNLNTDIYAQRLDASGTLQWGVGGKAICTAALWQLRPQLTIDGSGNTIIVWQDGRNGNDNFDIYAQRLDINGNSLWNAGGVAICTAANTQEFPGIIAGNSGDAIITWRDSRNGNIDIYAQRVDNNGNFLWNQGGLPICTETGDQATPYIIPDGMGGAILAWQNVSGGIYGQRVNKDGLVQWKENGMKISDGSGFGHMIADGSGGAILIYSYYVQRITEDGILK